MAVKYLESATCFFHGSNTKKQYPSLQAAREAAEAYVGNCAAAKPWPNEDTYFYGPGNGDTSVTVRRDMDMDAFMARMKS